MPTEVLTIGRVARVCRVSSRTAAKWFDSGQLRGYRIPGSRDRRVETSELLHFMRANALPQAFIDELGPQEQIDSGPAAP